jgi:hypothetical protein
MAHFAQLNENWVVQQVIAVDDSILLNQQGLECDWLGEQFCQSLYGPYTKWIQTSYNGSKYKNFAGIGYTFDPYRNAFIPPKPYPSWILNEKSCQWEAPVQYPIGGGLYGWDEKSGAWLAIDQATE